jgi:hypothetical protein
VLCDSEISTAFHHNVSLEYHRYDIQLFVPTEFVTLLEVGRAATVTLEQTWIEARRRSNRKAGAGPPQRVPSHLFWRTAITCEAGRRHTGTWKEGASLSSPVSTAFQSSVRSSQTQAWRAPNGRFPLSCTRLSDLVLVPHAKPLDQFRETFGGPPFWKSRRPRMRATQ